MLEEGCHSDQVAGVESLLVRIEEILDFATVIHLYPPIPLPAADYMSTFLRA
jgi:hypothetical protein